jgi:hypothetical protein
MKLLLTFLAMIQLVQAVGDVIGTILQNSMVWHAGAMTGSYIAFRKTFNTSTISVTKNSHHLAIFADSRYVLYVNGQRVAFGPERFDWRAPTYDVIDLSTLLIENTENVLSILVHNYDTCEGAQAPNNMPEVCIVANPNQWWLDTPSGRFMNHVPGLTIALFNIVTNEITLTTDESWHTSNSTRYLRSRPVWASVPDTIDGRIDYGDPAWERLDFDDTLWANAILIDGKQWGPLTRRVIPNLLYTPVPLTILNNSNNWPIVLSDINSRVVLDASKQILASYSLALSNVTTSGLVISLTWYERHNETTGLLSHSYTTSTYTTAGKPFERFETVDVFGGRYIEINVTGIAPFSLSLVSVNATDARYPYELVASFDVPAEPFFSRLFSMAAATISINSADSYTDCSTRERAEWVGDAVINLYNSTRLAFATLEDDGSITYADTRLLKGVIKRALLSSRSFYPNFFQVKAHTASDRQDFNAVWTDYTFALITAMKRYLDITGDIDFIKSFWPDARSQLINILPRLQFSSGLGLFRETIFFTDPLFLDLTSGTTINAFAFAALSDGAAIARELGFINDMTLFSESAKSLRSALLTKSWNSTSTLPAFNAAVLSDVAIDGSTWTGPGGNISIIQSPSAYANFIALAKGVLDIDPIRTDEAIAYLCDASQSPLTQAAAPMASIQQLSALFLYGKSSKIDKIAIDIIRTNWATMVNANDVGTLWEFFDDSGEVSHNMGAAPLPFLLEHILGIKTTLPITPEHRLITIEPHLGDISVVNGVAVSELGPVGVSWRLTNGQWSSKDRAVTVDINVSISNVLPKPTRSMNTVNDIHINVSVAIPLADANTPPPESANVFLSYCLYLSNINKDINVTEGLVSGQITLDNDMRYLRYLWNLSFPNRRVEIEPPHWLGGPSLRGLGGVESLTMKLESSSSEIC